MPTESDDPPKSTPKEVEIPLEELEADSVQRDFADRALRDALGNPNNLRPIVTELAPNIARHLDFEKLRPSKRDFYMGNWRKRESDLLLEVPYREADTEKWMFICILIEHQSQTDYTIPFRTLFYAVSYWEAQLKRWQRKKPKPGPFRLPPILPIVFHTGGRPWGSAKTLQDLLGPPQALHQYAPTWKPLFWELAKHSEGELLSSKDAFLQTLSIFQAEDTSLEEAQALASEVFERLERIYPSDSSHWSELVKLLFSWSQHRRPIEERESWDQLAQNLQVSAETKRELSQMKMTIAQGMKQEAYLEGEKNGKIKGEQIGERKGELQTTRRLLLRLGTKRMGAPSPEVAAKIQASTDVELLSELVENLFDFTSWDPISAKL